MLTAKDDVEASFLSWWDDLRERATSLQLRILIHEKAHVNVLSQIVGNDEAFGRLRLDKHSLEIDLLWSGVDLLELFTGELDAAISHFRLRHRFCLPFSLDDPVLVRFSSMSKTCQISLVRLVSIDWLLHVEKVDFSGQS